MGLFSGVKKKIKKAAKKLKKKAKKAAEGIEEAASAAGNAVGNLIEEGANAFQDGWLGNMISGVGIVIATAVRAIFDVTGGVTGGIIRVVAAIATLNASLFAEGLGAILAAIVGSVILGFLDVVSLIQRSFFGFVEENSRPLTARESTILSRIFHDSLDYDVIRLVIGRSGAFAINDRPFTKGNIIYMKDNYLQSSRMEEEDEGLLVHEAVHVWQYQNRGVRYISEAAYAQAFIDDEYNWEHEIIARDKKDWVEFNKEAQGKFFEDLHKHGRQVDRTLNPPGGAIPQGYDFAGAFFVEPRDPSYEPIFPFHHSPISQAFPASGHLFEKIAENTEIAIKATRTVREG